MNIIYFLQRANGDIKIGTTAIFRFKRRRKQLENMHGSMTLLGIMEGSYAEEKALHKQFSEHQCTVVGPTTHPAWRGSIWRTEFFAPTDEVVKFIESNRADFNIVEKWCAYFKVGVGDILTYTPDTDA